MSHGGKLTTIEAMGAPRIHAPLGDAVAATPTASPELVRDTLRQVETARDAMATEVVADSAALADARAMRRSSRVRGMVAPFMGRGALVSVPRACCSREPVARGSSTIGAWRATCPRA